jgi:DNA-binding transcriptional MerR regulator
MSTHAINNKSYTIKEAARLSGLPESTLRYYETVGIIEPIERDASSKHRVYSQGDVDLIDAIACLNATGMSLNDMRAYLDNRHKGVAGAQEEIKLLMAQKQRIEDEARFLKLRAQYVALKISYWEAVKAGDDAQVAAIGSEAKILANDLKFPNK